MRDLLLDLADADRRLTAELGEGHPRVRELRDTNARELELIVDEDGWPTPDEAGEDGADAALLIAVHAVSRPAFQRRCLTMMKTAALHGELSDQWVTTLEAAITD